MNRITRRQLALTAAAVVLASGLPAGPAQAAPDTTSAYQEQTITAALAANPGGRPISADTIELTKGVQLRVPETPDAILGCPDGFLCLNGDTNYSGPLIQFQACGFVQLANFGYPLGGTWQDKISSIRNGQTGGVTSRFYDFNGAGQPIETMSLRADNAIPNIGTVDNRIDRIFVC